MDAAAKISSQYSDIVSLATRQAMSTLDFTVGTDSNGNLVPDDIKVFMKNLGTDRFVLLALFPLTVAALSFETKNLVLTVIFAFKGV